jgi:hypothetical protein
VADVIIFTMIIAERNNLLLEATSQKKVKNGFVMTAKLAVTV